MHHASLRVSESIADVMSIARVRFGVDLATDVERQMRKHRGTHQKHRSLV